jgi:Fe-S oxidoreductase
MLNLKDAGDLRKFEAILEETADLVKKYGGSLSGEHGDGRLRGPFLRRMFSPKTCDLFLQVKRLFDPRGIFNPGKIVEAPPVTECLRAHPGSRTPEVETVFDWSRQEGLVRATEACNGAGFCRQGAGRGTMCPSYMATGEEACSTRGRANVLRQLLTSEDPDRAWTSPEVERVMDTCLSCKGCASECPSNVDMARLKAEYLQKKMDRKGIPLRSFLMGHYGRFARLARAAPRMASWWINRKSVKRFLGIAVERQVPAYASRTLVRWFQSRSSGARPALHGASSLRGEVFLLADEFTNYSEPEVGIAVVEFLEAAGFRVILPCGNDSGRTQISKGFLRSARKRMARAVEVLFPWAERGLPIVGIEPSTLLGFRDEAPDLVPPALRARAEKVKASCLLFEEFVARKAEEGALDRVAFAPTAPARLLLHGHCQQKAIAGTSSTVAALRRIPGLDVAEISSGCCGMAGAFGYEKEHYELSLRVAELVLFPAIRAEPDAILCAPGTSCRHQIADGTGRKAFHPAQVLRAALDPGLWAAMLHGEP